MVSTKGTKETFECNLSIEEFPKEPLPIDSPISLASFASYITTDQSKTASTILHGLERAMGYIAQSEGYSYNHIIPLDLLVSSFHVYEDNIMSESRLIRANSSKKPDKKRIVMKIFQHYKEKREIKIINTSGLFDRNYYLSHNPDVMRANIDPIVHYVKYGWKEGRSPNSTFNDNMEHNKNLNINKVGITPLANYILSTKKEVKKTKYTTKY